LAAHAEAVGAFGKPVLSGRIKLGVPDDYAEPYLTPVLRRFCGQFPSVEIELHCEQSTSLIPRTVAGELDISLISRDRPGRAKLLFREPLVWVGTPEYDLWQLDPLPLASYESTSMATVSAVAALHSAKRSYRVVSNSSNLAGHITAVRSGIAIACLTRCSVPSGAVILGERHGLPPLGSMDVGILRSKASRGRPAVDALQTEMERTIEALVAGRAY
jgi:DNA-binding transcriptional LysR family regulator